MLSLLLILTAAFAVLTWKNLHAGFLLLVAVLPSYLLRTEILGVPTTLLELLVVTFLVVWSVKRVARNELTVRSMFHVSRFTLPIVLLLLASTVSLFVAPDLSSALGVWKAYFLEPILLFFVIRYELTRTDSMDANRSPDRIMSSHLFQALGVSAIILSLVGIAQWLTGAGLPIPWDIERRVTSVFDYPNALGLFLGPIVVVGTVTLLSPFRGVAPDGAKAPMKIFWVTTILLSSIAIVLAQSEAAIVSVIATLLIAGFLKMIREGLEGTEGLKRLKGLIPLVLLVLLVLLILLLPPLSQKLTLQDYSGQVRLSQWSETIDMLGDHWLLGAGLSGYPTALEPYHQATHLEIFQYPHNIVLNIWVELGLLGLVAFVLLAWQVIVSLRATKGSEAISFGKSKGIASSPSAPLREPVFDKLRPRACRGEGSSEPRTARNDTQWIVFLALIQMTIHGLVDVPYFKNDLAILTWILLAIILSKDCFLPAGRQGAGAPAVAKAMAGRRNDKTYVSFTPPTTPS